MYTGKICHNSIMGDHINFILGYEYEWGSKW